MISNFVGSISYGENVERFLYIEQLVIECGDVTEEGTSFIIVVYYGTWAKGSY